MYSNLNYQEPNSQIPDYQNTYDIENESRRSSVNTVTLIEEQEKVKQKKSNFVSNVLTIVDIQIVITFIINYLFYVNKEKVIKWCFKDNPNNYGQVVMLLFGLTMFSMFFMWCAKNIWYLKTEASLPSKFAASIANKIKEKTK